MLMCRFYNPRGGDCPSILGCQWIKVDLPIPRQQPCVDRSFKSARAEIGQTKHKQDAETECRHDET
jgi:hypothetical protein